MQRPQFTRDEEFVIRYARRGSAEYWKDAMWSVSGQLVPACLFVGYGVVNDSLAAAGLGFVILVIFKLRELWSDARWISVWSSLIEKYEACFQPPATGPEQSPRQQTN